MGLVQVIGRFHVIYIPTGDDMEVEHSRNQLEPDVHEPLLPLRSIFVCTLTRTVFKRTTESRLVFAQPRKATYGPVIVEQVVVRFCKVQIVLDGKENLLLNPTM
jgi:hypothetical protein